VLHWLRKHFKTVGFGIWLGIALAMLPMPAYAIDDPDGITINSVYVYRHCLETDDQLYIVEYNLDYSVTGNPTENASEAYLVRLMNGAVELGSSAPYAFYDDGYGRGIASIYFSAADAPAWLGDYTLKLAGNPTLAWVGDPPSTSVGTFDLWSGSTSLGATEIELGARVLYFADILELEWSVDLIETSGVGSWLTEYGEDYFTNSIQYLPLICPNVFSSSLSQPDYTRKTFTPTYATTLRSITAGTPLDLSPTAGIIGMPTIWFTTLIFLGIMAVAAYGISRATGSVKPTLIVMASLLPVGIMIGWVDLVVGILMGFAAIIAIAYVFFLQKSSA